MAARIRILRRQRLGLAVTVRVDAAAAVAPEAREEAPDLFEQIGCRPDLFLCGGRDPGEGQDGEKDQHDDLARERTAGHDGLPQERSGRGRRDRGGGSPKKKWTK